VAAILPVAGEHEFITYVLFVKKYNWCGFITNPHVGLMSITLSADAG